MLDITGGNGCIDITSYSDQELSLIVFNDADLYRLIEHTDELLEAINQNYIYADEQLNELLNDIEECLE